MSYRPLLNLGGKYPVSDTSSKYHSTDTINILDQPTRTRPSIETQASTTTTFNDVMRWRTRGFDWKLTAAEGGCNNQPISQPGAYGLTNLNCLCFFSAVLRDYKSTTWPDSVFEQLTGPPTPLSQRHVAPHRDSLFTAPSRYMAM